MKASETAKALSFAVVAAGSAAALLHASPTVRLVVPAIFAMGAFVMSRWPAVGASIICLGQATGLAMGVSHESASGLVAGLGAMYILGRRSRPARALVPLVLAWSIIVATDVLVVRQVLGLTLFGAAYAMGIVVRQTAERARLAEADARRLEAEEVASRAQRIVEHERRRLAQTSTRLLISASSDMSALARSAREDLDPEKLAQVRRRGEDAVDELRSLLDMLRTPRPLEFIPPASAPSSTLRADVSIATLVSGLALVEWTIGGSRDPVPWWLWMVTAALVFRRGAPALGCWVAAAGFVGQWASGVPFVTGPALSLSLAVLTWSALVSPTPARVMGVLTLSGTCLLATSSMADNNNVFVAVGILLGTAISSRIWNSLERRHREARARSLAYSRRLRTTVDGALTNERLGGARDLHDVASRAIGIMLMHTSIAEVHRTRDPSRAREALATVEAAGDGALSELAALEHTLAPGHGDNFPAMVSRLVERTRSAGVDVSLQLTAQPRDPEVAAALWRIVHEALTNVLKHAPGARARVTVRREGHEVVVVVRDDGTGVPGKGVGTGHGLRGLVELVDRSHGSLRHGPIRRSGETGFEVVARFADPPSSTREPWPGPSSARS